ncbi:deleted in malignant brain tumors 1 protein-like isoform X1 [Lytechinus variegatus]|uniref:deleted in malignant brain tumors 1 protein-like isoform X1 n=1 Tax=Lytechinus variegatus TaxID=7654 RepID=UPI001BB15F43|nr:deleted in malignant brain tumors 1 protein-like isoform X1 [Lytechinus variegatus]
MDEDVLRKLSTIITVFFFASSSKLFGTVAVLAQGEYEGGIRLVDGTSAYEGRIEIYHSGEWGTICDDSWDTNDGEVACRQLGYSGVDQAFQGGQFGEGSGTIWLDDLRCSGSEKELSACSSSGWGVHNCGHSEDAGLRCSSISLGTELRLVGGSLSNEGRVEIYYSGEWGTICDDYWDINDGAVACRQLGYSGVDQVYQGGQFGEGSGTIWLDDLQCSGSEDELSACSSKGWGVHNCGHSEDAGLRCSSISGTELRLVGGSTSNEGRVEIYYSGEWGTICDDLWDINDGVVACRQLGYSGVDQVFQGGQFGEGSGTIWLDDLQCSGLEEELSACSSNGWGVHNCGHSEDAGLRCSSISLETELRLVGGSTSNEGRVEIYYSGEWGTICDDSWDINDGEVACRQLGYSGVDQVFQGGQFGEGSGTIWLDDLRCSGSEDELSACSSNGWGVHNCGHSEDAGVRCSSNSSESELRLVSGSSSNEGRVEIYYSGEWGTICDDSWDTYDGAVVCRQLGYPGVEEVFSEAYFGEGVGRIWIDNMECSGSELTLQQCPSNTWGNHNCGHSEDAGVRCAVSASTEGAVRLVDGPNDAEGRLEIFHDGQWGTVCDDTWDLEESRVVCQQLGFKGEGYFTTSIRGYQEATGSIWLDSVQCNGDEGQLSYCTHDGWGVHDCGHSEDVGVECHGLSSSGLSGWEIFGIVAGCLTGVFFFYHCCLKKGKNESSPSVPTQRTEITLDVTGGDRTQESGDSPPEDTGELALTHLGDPNSSLPDVPPPAYEDIGKFSTLQMPDSEALYPPPSSTGSFVPPSQPYNSAYPYPPPPPSVSYPPPPPPEISDGSVAYLYSPQVPSSATSLPPAS